MTIYAIGDIHGQIGMLEDALEKIARDGGDDSAHGTDEVIFLGDLVDRGPHSREVNEHLRQGIADGRRWTALMGNHDMMFRRFVEGGVVHDPAIKSGKSWLTKPLGGRRTLASYGVDVEEGRPFSDIFADAREAVPLSHRAFLRERPLWQERAVEGLFFVHAGLRPGVPLQDQTVQDLTWIRDDFYGAIEPFPWLIVHGHTVMERPSHFGTRIDLDTGAGAPDPKYLTVAAFEGQTCFILTDEGRSLLEPGMA